MKENRIRVNLQKQISADIMNFVNGHKEADAGNEKNGGKAE